MPTIPDYAPPVLPLSGGDYVAVWQDSGANGGQKGARVADIAQFAFNALSEVDPSEAAASALIAQQAAAQSKAAYRKVSSIADRDAINPADLSDGLRVYVAGDALAIGGNRVYEWVTAGSLNPDGTTATTDGWVGLYTPAVFSFGNFLDTLTPFGNTAAAGASLAGDFGVSIPAGSSGAGSYVRPRWVKDFSSYAGAIAVIRMAVTRSATFTRALQGVFQVSTASNPFVTRMDEPGTRSFSETVGDTTTFTFEYVIQGDEIALNPYATIAASPDAGADEAFEVAGLSFGFLAANDPFRTAPDQTIELLKSDLLSTVSEIYTAGTGNVIDRLDEFGQALANGAVASDEFEITVPSGSAGNGSFFRPRWEHDFSAQAGAGIEVKLRIAKSATFTRQLVPTFQLSTAANPFVVRDANLVTRDDPTETVFIYRYTAQGDEVALNPYVSINPGQTAVTTADEVMSMDGFSVEFVSSVDEFGSPANYNLDMVKDELLGEARAFTILRPTFVDTITVKPSGGHFTTISDAIAALSNTSVRQQYQIAWWAGAAIGTPNFHIPAYTAIVCQDRTDDAILSFVNPNDVSADATTNTVLAWIDQDGVVIDGGTWQITNGRYVFHWETNGNYPDTQQALINLVAEHLGNAGAINNAWGIASQVAVGIGVSGGQQLDIRNCRLSGPGGGLLAHSPANVDWTTAFEIDIEGTRLEGTNTAYPDLVIKPIRKGPGRVNLTRCAFDALSYTDAEWIGGDPGGGVNTAQIAVTASSVGTLTGAGSPAFQNAIGFGAAAGASYTWYKPV